MIGSVGLLLTALTWKKTGQFWWTDTAWEMLEELKERLASELPFVVEVNVSEVGFGAVLSQHSGWNQKLQPCSYLSLWLTLCSYGVSNRELLAVEMTLEDWRH